MSKRLVIGIGLITIGFTCIVVRRHWLNNLDVTPVNIAVPDVPAHISTGNFNIAVKYLYVIDLRFPKPHPGAIDCLLSADRSTCRDRSVLQLKWELYSENRLLKSGAISNPQCYLAGVVVCPLGSFDGRPAERYRTDIEVLNFAFAGSRPRLIIQPYKDFFTDWGATYYFVEPLAIACSVGGMILLALVTLRPSAPILRPSRLS